MSDNNQSDHLTDLIEGFIDSYEARIKEVEELFNSSEAVSESTDQLHNEFKNALHLLHEERSQLNGLLRAKLAKDGSLRRNDYDSMMHDVFLLLKNKEQDANRQFAAYINDQKDMVRLLRERLLRIRNEKSADIRVKAEQFKEAIRQIMHDQHERKSSVISRFTDFQQTHTTIIHHLKLILEKEGRVNSDDIKSIRNKLLEELN